MAHVSQPLTEEQREAKAADPMWVMAELIKTQRQLRDLINARDWKRAYSVADHLEYVAGKLTREIGSAGTV